jgi:ketosteroid isomerase-like protein
MTQQEKTIELADIPELITNYLKAHKARDLEAALGSYAPDATVTDEDKNYHGLDEIRAWLSRSASQYTYTIEVIGATEIDQDHYDVTHHLEGDFPGGQVDLHFRFGLRDGAIRRLVVAP